jgi:hypothetical protein
MRNFNKAKFSDAISRKFTRLRFSDIHNPSLRFLHRWKSFTLFPKYTLVTDIVDYFKMFTKYWDPSSVPPWSLRLP